MIMKEDKRLIEETFPIKKIGELSSKDKYLSNGHIQTIHPWWARRPLAASRSTIYSALINNPKNKKELQKEIEFIIKLSEWKNSLEITLLDKARKEIDKNRKSPKILDPFSGGGSIPLEALRLGCEVYANDINTVPYFMLNAILNFSQKFSSKKNEFVKQENKILQDVKKYSKWVFEEAEKEIGQFYPNTKNHMAYIWCRAIKCRNPKCGKEIPLMKKFLISDKKISIYPSEKDNKITFNVVGKEYKKIPKMLNNNLYDVMKGTIKGSKVTCIFCSTLMEDDELRNEFQNGRSFERMVTSISTYETRSGKHYQNIINNDYELYEKAKKYLSEKNKILTKKWGISAIPEEHVMMPDGKEYAKIRSTGRKDENGNQIMENGLYFNYFPIVSYGLTKWRDLFNSRQMLALLTFTEKINHVFDKMIKDGNSEEYAKIILVYLSLLLSRMANRMSNLTYWYTDGEKIQPTYIRQALAMTFDFIEMNPFNNSSGGWKQNVKDGLKVIEHLTKINVKGASVYNVSATKLPFQNEFFDAVFTDPPYYNNVPYSHISDFFYVWLKRCLMKNFPENFPTLLTNKSEEAVSDLPMIRGMSKDIAKEKHPGIKSNEDFEMLMKKSLIEINRVLKKNGICIIVYAHKTTEGWETLINSLLDSGLIVTAAWPIPTEMKSRRNAQETASLASSIYMVCRKLKKQPHETYTNVKKQMKEYLDDKLDFLHEEGIRGADFPMAAIGSAIEVFGKYEQITDTSDKEIKVPQLLDDVRKLVSEYTINKVLHGEIGGEISTMTRFYVLWREAYGQAKVPYDDARKLATSLGVNLEQEWDKGFIRKEKGMIRVIGPEDRSIEDIKEPTEMIDVLHKVLILWRNGKKDEYEKLLDEAKYAKSDTFRRVGQAISESLPDTQEKKMLDGFLNQYSSGESVSDDKQTKLF